MGIIKLQNNKPHGESPGYAILLQYSRFYTLELSYAKNYFLIL
jgi:hypothetical protein